ncbi:type VI secretion system-associated FHA domain protein TagH [Vibrio aestuarianus]|uniref:type VI secretion system-associated FHA domain protein TagH n=1 Tax=Vibrio aestuarianus TaxID=28171 RepID=UPI00237C5DF2|nr:type VI secretion system-associated FHA domain protein TagH [Vibrio aestuarianus]MDE1349428.1 type VI secretion system-associated FHA domain protein TagH [Vibrio aestuarianus]
MQQKRTLSLIVTNVQHLESGLAAQCIFNQQGGVIGTVNDAHWRLRDSAGHIHNRHCEIRIVDGAFCIQDLCGHTYVNGSHMPLGQGELAKLSHKDEVTLGPYQIRVVVGNVGEDDLLAHGSLDQLFEQQSIDLLKDASPDELDTEESNPEQNSADPITALDELFNDIKQEESLLEEAEKIEPQHGSSLLTENDSGPTPLQFTPQADSEYEMTSSIRLKKILGLGKRPTQPELTAGVDRTSTIQAVHTKQHDFNDSNNNVPEGLAMDDKVLDLLEEEVAKSYQPHTDVQRSTSENASHLLTGPMLNGLGVEVGDNHDMAKMHMLSEELGQSLQACVQGLLELHQQVREGRFGMMNRNLQPIEDNPLRLGLSYEETIRTLYDADKSLVHLSAPAAISESLKNVRDHNEAMQHATTEALNQILNAFSPQVLLRRFHHYKRNSDQQNQSSESWAWQMYCNYYQELTSNRQKGFEKLFWEIFEQSYDKKIREKQLEL